MSEKKSSGSDTRPDTPVINADYLLLILMAAAEGIFGIGTGSGCMFAFGLLETAALAVITYGDKPNFLDTNVYQKRMMGDTAMGYLCSAERPVQNTYLPAVEAVCLLLALVIPAGSAVIGAAKWCIIFGYTVMLALVLLRWKTDVYWVAGEYRCVRVWYQKRAEKKED